SDPTLRLAENNSSTDYLEIIDVSGTNAGILKRAQSGNVTFSIDPIPTDGTSLAQVTCFRTTNTTGPARIVVHKGDGTVSANCIISGNTDSYFNALTGNVGIGTTTATEKLTVNGN